MSRAWIAICVAGCVLGLGCPEEEPEVPSVAGEFPLVVTLTDGDCYPDGVNLFHDSFLTWMAEESDGTWGMMEIVQDGTDLIVEFGECTFGGTIDVTGEIYFGGDCVTSEEGADITVNFVGTGGPDADDSSIPAISGDMTIAADHEDVDGNPEPDGEVDCSRQVTVVGRAM